jgi:hypothetical protein
MKTNAVIDPILKINVAFETWQAPNNKLLIKSFLKKQSNPQIFLLSLRNFTDNSNEMQPLEAKGFTICASGGLGICLMDMNFTCMNRCLHFCLHFVIGKACLPKHPRIPSKFRSRFWFVLQLCRVRGAWSWGSPCLCARMKAFWSPGGWMRLTFHLS